LLARRRASRVGEVSPELAAIRVRAAADHSLQNEAKRERVAMIDVDTGLFTVAVFQDVAWATKGLDALTQAGFPAESLTVLAKDNADVAALVERFCGVAGERLDVTGVGAVVARGRLVDALQGTARDLPKLGFAATMRRVGFQPHDGRIFETLIGRGGVLVAIKSDPRAADALAILHSYGGGNAAIGAWTGRV
jgi:hypothetical protein